MSLQLIVRCTVSRSHMVVATAHHLWSHYVGAVGLVLSRQALLDAAEGYVREYGVHYAGRGVQNDKLWEFWGQAEMLVAEFFPELKPESLTQSSTSRPS
jgi:hypothetical protein